MTHPLKALLKMCDHLDIQPERLPTHYDHESQVIWLVAYMEAHIASRSSEVQRSFVEMRHS